MNKTIALLCWLSSLPASGIGQVPVPQTLADSTWISYRLIHPLHTIDARSNAVQYHIVADPLSRKITGVTASVDVTTFDSGNSNRDSHAMEVIDAITYPDAGFSSTTITEKGDSLFVAGNLTFHGVTKGVTMAGVFAWSPGRLEVHGGFDISLTEFKVDRPALLLIPVEDKLAFALNAVFVWKN